MATVDLGIIATFINRTKADFARLRGDLSKTEKAANNLSRGLRAIHVVLASIATGSLIQFGKSVLNTAATLEKATVRLAFLEGGFKKADETFAKLRQQFRGVPIETKTLLDGFSRLKAAGLDPLDGSMKAIVDSVSAFGGGTDEMNRTFIAIQQIAGKGTLQMEELRQQLGETVPFALQIMAKETGRTVPKFIQAVSDGMVSANEAITAFVAGAKKHFKDFSELMALTIEGGQTRIKTAFEDLIKRVFGEFKLDTRIGIILGEIADLIDDISKNITQADVDKWVTFLEDIAIAGAGAAQAMMRVGTFVIELVRIVTQAMGSLGGDLLTSGFIGRMLFGRFGAALGMFTTLMGRVFGDALALSKAAKADVETILGDAITWGLVGFLLLGKKGLLIGAALGAVKQDFLKWIDDAVIGWARITDFIGLTTGRAEKLAGIVAGMRAEGKSATGDILAGLTGGDKPLETSFDRTLQGILDKARETTDDVRARQEQIIQQNERLKVSVAEMAESEKKARQKSKKALDLEIAAMRSKLDLVRITQATADLQRGMEIQPFTSGFTDEAREKQREFANQALQTQLQILQIRKKMVDATAEQRSIFEAHIVALERQQVLLQDAVQQTTAHALLIQETWTSIGDTIADSAKRGLSEFVKGTADFKTITTDLFNSMTDLAADYIIELLKIKALQAVAGFQGGGAAGGGGGFFGSVVSAIGGFFGGGFAQGAAFPGGTSLSSGIMRGPQAFGIGGESGPEGVLPLDSVGGKLGVNAKGLGGGDQFNISITAMDTQSALEVLMANAGEYTTVLRGQRNLEKSSV